MTAAVRRRNWLQLAMIACLVAGSFLRLQPLLAVAAVLAIVSTIVEWRGVLRLARVFAALAVAAAVAVALLAPDQLPALWRAFVQGVSFAALMMVLGMLRNPVRRSPLLRAAAEYLLAFEARRRYAAINAGSLLLSLLFNIGVIALIGDLARGHDQVGRRPIVVASMRGAALATIWSPFGLGVAVVTSGVPALDPLRFMVAALLFTALALVVTAAWPMLPAEASRPSASAPSGVEGSGSAGALAAVLAICLGLLVLTIAIHQVSGLSFTLASVAVFPLVTAAWLLFESRGDVRRYLENLRGTLAGLSDLRSESALFLSANVIGSAVSIGLMASPAWKHIAGADYPMAPVIIAALVIIPAMAMLFIPNTIFVVILAQLLGPSPVGAAHPLALGLALTVAWSCAAVVSPISAMCLITAGQSGVTSRRVAWRWNTPFAATVSALAAAVIVLLMVLG